MPRPSRTRRILKWTGAVLMLLILAAWTLSIDHNFFITLGNHNAVGFEHGNIVAGLFSNFDITYAFSTPYQLMPIGRKGFGLDWPQLPFRMPVYLSASTANYCSLGMIPFWLPFLLTAIPTAWLWHRDRRRIRPGCCLRCGYDLTGNTSGVCSECGLPATPAPKKLGP